MFLGKKDNVGFPKTELDVEQSRITSLRFKD